LMNEFKPRLYKAESMDAQLHSMTTHTTKYPRDIHSPGYPSFGRSNVSSDVVL
jgi:hypothetical protein